MEISIVPLGTKTASVSKYVANSIKALKRNKDIRYKLTPMGTIVETETIEKLLDIAAKMHNVVFNDKVKRVVTTIKIDDRKDKKITMRSKIKSVQRKLRI